MNNVNGLTVINDYLPEFNWVRDIQFFDGPLMSQYETATGEIYIFHWCDCSDDANRWLAVRVSKRSLQELTSGLISMRELLVERNQDSTFYLLDINNDAEFSNAILTHLDNIPVDYLPEEGEMISPELFLDYDNESYSIIIDGKWESEELTNIQRKFADVYSLIFSYTRDIVQFNNLPWLGGFSSFHFYNKLKMDTENLFNLKGMAYSSPGYIEFFANRKVALKVKENVNTFINHKDDIRKVYNELNLYLRDQELNQEDKIPTNEQSLILAEYAMGLFEFFEEPTFEWVNSKTNDAFKSAKVAKSYYVRVREIAKYIEEERAELGRL